MSKTDLPSLPKTPAGACEERAPAFPLATGSASVAYDHVTRQIIMGIICEVADVVNVSEVKRCADRVMATMARRKKPNRLWAVEAVVLPNSVIRPRGFLRRTS